MKLNASLCIIDVVTEGKYDIEKKRISMDFRYIHSGIIE